MTTENYRYWRVKYIDKWTNGKVSETEIHGYYDEEGVVDFFGLDEPDVYYYEIEEFFPHGHNKDEDEE